jgi:hypothetical protein
MASKVIVKQTSVTWAVTIFLLVRTFRFFSGRPMNGKNLDNSSFTKGATRGRPGRTLTRWQKKPHMHRALIRGAVFWPIVGIIALAMWDKRIALSVCACSIFPLGYLAFRKGRFLFFDPYTSTDAVNGVSTQHWFLKNRYRRLFRMQPRPGYVAKRKRTDISGEFPPDVEKILREAINADNPGERPALKVTPYKRRSIK